MPPINFEEALKRLGETIGLHADSIWDLYDLKKSYLLSAVEISRILKDYLELHLSKS